MHSGNDSGYFNGPATRAMFSPPGWFVDRVVDWADWSLHVGVHFGCETGLWFEVGPFGFGFGYRFHA